MGKSSSRLQRNNEIMEMRQIESQPSRELDERQELMRQIKDPELKALAEEFCSCHNSEIQSNSSFSDVESNPDVIPIKKKAKDNSSEDIDTIIDKLEPYINKLISDNRRLRE